MRLQGMFSPSISPTRMRKFGVCDPSIVFCLVTLLLPQRPYVQSHPPDHLAALRQGSSTSAQRALSRLWSHARIADTPHSPPYEADACAKSMLAMFRVKTWLLSNTHQSKGHIDAPFNDPRLIRNQTPTCDLAYDIPCREETLQARGTAHLRCACVGDIADCEDVRCVGVIEL